MSSATAAPGKARHTEHGRVASWLQRLESPVTTYYVLLSVTAVLVIIGLIMVLSASAIVSYKNSDSSYTIFIRQAQFAVVGAIAMAVASRLSVARWKSLAVPALLGAMALQLLVFTPLGKSVNGNTNWIGVGGVTVQPSEFAKLGLVLFGAAVLTRKRKLLGQFKHALVPYVVPFSGLAILPRPARSRPRHRHRDGRDCRGRALHRRRVLEAVRRGRLQLRPPWPRSWC